MTVTTSERPTKRSGAAARRPDWTADATLAEMIRRILAVGEPQKIVLFGSRARGMPARTATMICCWSSHPCFRATSRGPLSPCVAGLAGAKDILVWTPEEVAQWRDVPNAFVTAAVQEGVVLYERPV